MEATWAVEMAELLVPDRWPIDLTRWSGQGCSPCHSFPPSLPEVLFWCLFPPSFNTPCHIFFNNSSHRGFRFPPHPSN